MGIKVLELSGYPQMTQMGDGRWQISRRHGAGTLRIAPTAHDEIAQTTGLGMTKNGTGGLQARFHVMESRRVGCFTRRHEDTKGGG